MPAILSAAEECDTWLSAEPAEALKLQRPLSDELLKIVATGKREDRRIEVAHGARCLRSAPLATAMARDRLPLGSAESRSAGTSTTERPPASSCHAPRRGRPATRESLAMAAANQAENPNLAAAAHRVAQSGIGAADSWALVGTGAEVP
jgi:hypothetical protein